MTTPANLFGSGIRAAAEYRDQLLRHLDAQALLADEDSEIVTWIPAVLGTRFGVVPATSEVTDLAELVVYTPLGTTTDIESARALVAMLNDVTSLNTWAVLGDPGPEGWWDNDQELLADLPYAVPGQFRRQNHLVSLPAEAGVYTITVGFSIVVGHASVDIPVPIAAAIVSEQVAKATAIATHDSDLPWLERSWVPVGDSLRPSSEWEDVVFFFDNVITPRSEQEPQRLPDQLGRALVSIQSQQCISSPGTWAGGGAGGFTCEVPYGPGPFPGGVIGRNMVRGVESHEGVLTALVQGVVVENPYLGKGLLVFTKIPEAAEEIQDPAWWSASLLNNLPRLRTPTSSPAEAHGLGTWVVRDGQPVHFVFVPVAWEELFTEAELLQFFEQVLTNAARVVWRSRKVREPFESLFPAGLLQEPLPPMGLVAGIHSRGLAFGEPGLGSNPAAAALNSIYALAVGQDREWSSVHQSLFFLDTGVSLVQVSAVRCDCTPPGCIVDVQTACPNPPTDIHLQQLVKRGLPAMVLGEGPGQVLLSRLHLHDSRSAGMAAFGPIGLQALAAALTGAGVQLGLRPQVDELVNIRLARPDYARPDEGTSAGMARAAEMLGAHSAQPLDWNSYALAWSPSGSREVRTIVRYQDDPDMGAMLLISTEVPHSGGEIEGVRQSLQEALLADIRNPISGDYQIGDGCVSVLNSRWVASDPGTDQREHAEWVGDLVLEHAAAVGIAVAQLWSGEGD